MIILKTLKQVDGIRRSCKIVSYMISELTKEAKPGVTTLHLNNLAEKMCLDKGCRPGVKGYRGYPYAICCSKNNTVVHGFPNNEPLKDGDILSIDIGVEYEGWWGDSAVTIPIGNITKEASDLIYAAKECLSSGIYASMVNNRIGDISYAIQSTCENIGMSIIKEFVGHGIGKELHEKPQVLNFGKPNTGTKIKSGMVLAIEPIISNGSGETIVLGDGWNVLTKDDSLAAHFEHTILVTSDGCEILTSAD